LPKKLSTLIVPIKVKPNAKKDKMAYSPEGLLTIWIKAQPVDGKANKYLVDYLASVFKLPKSSIELISGETSQMKRFSVDLLEREVIELIQKEIEHQK
jgi:uncharacterized protein (TIGR00251 family)